MATSTSNDALPNIASLSIRSPKERSPSSTTSPKPEPRPEPPSLTRDWIPKPDLDTAVKEAASDSDEEPGNFELSSVKNEDETAAVPATASVSVKGETAGSVPVQTLAHHRLSGGGGCAPTSLTWKRPRYSPYPPRSPPVIHSLPGLLRGSDKKGVGPQLPGTGEGNIKVIPDTQSTPAKTSVKMVQEQHEGVERALKTG